MQRWPTIYKLLHLCLALFVTLQLLTSQLMHVEIDEAGHMEEDLLFEVHEYSGLFIFLVTVVHILIALAGSERRRALFPWSGNALGKVIDDTRALLSGSLPAGGYLGGGLAGFVHGLGLLAVLLAATLGVGIFLTLKIHGAGHELFEVLEEAHELAGSLVIVYWVGHVGMALLHRLKGERSVFSIFPFSRD